MITEPIFCGYKRSSQDLFWDALITDNVPKAVACAYEWFNEDKNAAISQGKTIGKVFYSFGEYRAAAGILSKTIDQYLSGKENEGRFCLRLQMEAGRTNNRAISLMSDGCYALAFFLGSDIREKLEELKLLRGLAYLKQGDSQSGFIDLCQVMDQAVFNFIGGYYYVGINNSKNDFSEERRIHLHLDSSKEKLLFGDNFAEKMKKFADAAGESELSDIFSLYFEYLSKKSSKIENKIEIAYLLIGGMQHVLAAHKGKKEKEVLNALARLFSSELSRYYLISLAIELTDVPNNFALSTSDEKRALKAAGKLCELIEKFYSKKNDDFIVNLRTLKATALRRGPEDVSSRKKAVDILEGVYAEGLISDIVGETAIEADIQRAIAWREYLKALIHYSTGTRMRDNGIAAVIKGDVPSEIQLTFEKTKKLLEDNVRMHIDNGSVCGDLAWLFYIWGKYKGDHSYAVEFSRALLTKASGKKPELTENALLSSDIRGKLLSDQMILYLSDEKLGELQRVCGWSLLMMASRLIMHKRAAMALLEEAIPLARSALEKAKNRMDRMDAVYLNSQLYFLLGKLVSGNAFQKNVSSKFDNIIKWPKVGRRAVEYLNDGISVLSDELKKESEEVVAELFYGMGLIKAEMFEYKDIAKIFSSGLFHYGKSAPAYVKLLEVVDALQFVPKPKKIEVPECFDGQTEWCSDAWYLHILEDKYATLQADRSKKMDATELLLLALKRGSGKKIKIRRTLVDIFSYQIGRYNKGDRERGTYWILSIMLLAENVKEGSRDDADRLIKYLGHALEENVEASSGPAFTMVMEEVKAINLPPIKDYLFKKGILIPTTPDTDCFLNNPY